jgi:hypothetical protein
MWKNLIKKKHKAVSFDTVTSNLEIYSRVTTQKTLNSICPKMYNKYIFCFYFLNRNNGNVEHQ